MFEILGITPQALFAQLLIGLINGSFYAMMSLGLAIIFGLLNIINFAHGAQYMLGAFAAWIGLTQIGQWTGNPDLSVNYWFALVLAPLVVGIFGMIIERVMLKRLYHLDHLYGLLLTFGLALIIEGMFRHWYGISGESYDIPQALTGGMNLGFMFLPFYRAWVIVASLVICFATWYVIERTKLGAYLRAGTENSKLLQAFGVNVPLLITLTYGYGVALAALAGVMAAPIFQVNPVMGSNLIIVVFAVVVIGGMGSIFGAIVTGFGLGVIEGLTKVFYPEASGVVIFVIMAIVLLLRPAGLFGRENVAPSRPFRPREIGGRVSKANKIYIVLLIIGLLAPLQDAIYLVFIMKVLCFALFACAFNLLLGFVGLLSFGHAAFLGTAAYVAGYAAKVWGLTPRTRDHCGHACFGGARLRIRQPRHSPPGHLFRDDHAGAVADDLFSVGSVQVHRRRGRYSGDPARQTFRAYRSVQ